MFLILGVGADLISSILGGLVCPGGPKNIPKCGGLPPPPSPNCLEGAPGAAGAAQETKIRDASRPQNQVLKTVAPRASEVLFAVSVTDGTVVDRGASLNSPNPEPEV